MMTSTVTAKKKGDPQHKVEGKTVGNADEKYRCVVKTDFQK